MYLMLKKSKITAWWVAQKGSIFTFYNICAAEELPHDLFVVGYMKDSVRSHNYPDLATSSNSVVEITQKGVITSQGSFYPFDEAHALYLKYLKILNEAEENVAIATHWKLIKNKMTADVIINGKLTKNITFDFESAWDNDVVISGFSKELNSYVIVPTFSRRELACATLHIPYTVKDDIRYNASFAIESEKTECINRVRRFINGG